MANNNTKHQDNLNFVLESLHDKPVTTALFKQIIEFNANNMVCVEVIFPKRKVPLIEFEKEQVANGILQEDQKSDGNLTSYEKYYC